MRQRPDSTDLLMILGSSIFLASGVREGAGWTFEETIVHGVVAGLAILALGPLARRLLAPAAGMSSRAAVATVLVAILAGATASVPAMRAVEGTFTFLLAAVGSALVALATAFVLIRYSVRARRPLAGR